MRPSLVALILFLSLPGCVVIKVGAKNPIPEMTTIAVAPFFNLTQEPNSVVDGRRFALAYFAELQKTPGFQVIPVGVVESAILKYRLDLRNPREALRLCELVGADAIVIGGVTDYSPFYPPRIGMQVDWYSPREWPSALTAAPPEMVPGSEGTGGGFWRGWRCSWPISVGPEVVRGQSIDLGFEPSPATDRRVLPVQQTQTGPAGQPVKPPFGPDTPYDRARMTPAEEQERYGRKRQSSDEPPGDQPPSGPQLPADVPRTGVPPGGFPQVPHPTVKENSELAPPPWTPLPPPAIPAESPTNGLPPLGPGVTPPPGSGQFDPTLPLMSYTRIFDGADTEVINRLKDYLELRGDRRGGGWEAYLHRSEDYIRFTCHLMIVEMLSVHGGASKSQIIVKWRKYR